MLTEIVGPLGSGKTLILTLLAVESNQYIVSNYNLKMEHSKFDLYKFLISEYYDNCILIDEAYTLMDSRNSMSSINMLLSYTLFQSRKKSLDLILTVQLGSTLDIRYREMADRIIYAKGLVRLRNGNIAYKYIIQTPGKKTKIQYLNIEGAEYLYTLYDTNEIIAPHGLEAKTLQYKNKADIEEYINGILKGIRLNYPKGKVSRAKIEEYLFDEEIEYSNKFLNVLHVKINKDIEKNNKDVANNSE